MKPKIQVILGSIREGRAGLQVSQWLMDAIRQNPNAELEFVDLADYPMPLYADSNAVKNRTGQHPNPDVQKWLDRIAGADGYIMITPEYNHSYSSALKNAIDYGYKDWNNKPIGFVGYGGYAGGARAVEHLRQVAAELQMYDVRDQVVLPYVWQAFNEQGKLANGEFLAATANKIVDKVAELAIKLRQ